MAALRSMGVRSLLAAVLAISVLAGCIDSGGDPDQGATDSEATSVEPESGILSGTLTAVDALTKVPLPIGAGHGRLAFTLVLADNLPESDLGLNVTGPDGRSGEVDTSPILYAFPGNRPTISFSLPASGEWTATVELSSGASADYEVHWCADDADSTGPQDNLACQRSY